MRTMLRLGCAAALTVLLFPAAAAGQAPDPSRPPPRIGLRAYGIVALDAVAATESFNAVLGTSQLKAFGAGVDVVNLWKHLFARVAVTRARKEGSRVFVSGAEVFPLGIPLTVTMTPVEAGGGWRFESALGPRVTPYAGAAFLSMGYTETSQFAEAGENTSERFKGQAVFGGAEFGILKWLVASAEGQYRRVPDAAGAGGVSKEFNETDLGGFSARVTIGVRIGR
jgi:opacity protein-like surface antigen